MDTPFTVAAHSWPYYKDTEAEVKRRGLLPVKWCVDEVSDKARMMTPEELIWRMRMKYRPVETKKVFGELNIRIQR